MQLLQKLRDSNYLDQVTVDLGELEKRARSYGDKIRSFLTQSRGDIIVFSYTGHGYTPASLMYWYSVTFHSSKHPVLAESEESSIYILPYRDDVSIMIYSTGEYSKLIQTLQVARILDVDYLAFTIDPGVENIRSILRQYNAVILPYSDKDLVKAVVEMSIASFISISEYYKGGLATRGQRLFIHGQEGFASTVLSYIETYIETISDILRHEELNITSTRFLEAPSLLLVHALRQAGLKSRYIPLFDVSSVDQPVLAFLLSTDDRLRKELRSRRPGYITEFVLNLDPLEAIVYLAILAYTLSRSIS